MNNMAEQTDPLYLPQQQAKLLLMQNQQDYLLVISLK